jgi:hypothetical protein
MPIVPLQKLPSSVYARENKWHVKPQRTHLKTNIYDHGQVTSINLYLPITKTILMKTESIAILGTKCNKPNTPS